MRPALRIALATAGLLLAGCGGGDAASVAADGAGDAASAADAGGDATPPGPLADGATTDPGADADAPAADLAVEVADDAAPLPPQACADGAPAAALLEGSGFAFGDVAAPFVVNTLRGAWSMADHWDGCESYVLLTYFPDLRAQPSGTWIGDYLWGTDLAGLLRESPPNARYFFASFEEDAGARRSRMEAMRGRLEQALISLPGAEQQAHWAGRLHLVTDRVTEIEGGLGGWMRDYLEYLFSPASVADLGDRGQAQAPIPFAVGVDRGQRWDAVGGLDQAVGAPPALEMAAYAPHFYNHRAQVRARVASEADAAEVVLLEERTNQRVVVVTAAIPDAVETANELVFDVAVTCPHRNVFDCSEWDRIARIEHCEDAECAERIEILRWITPYWRRGERRWLIDASPFVGRIAGGGEHTFRIEFGPSWERATERDVRVALRLREVAGEPRARRVTRAFGGGGFNAEYDANHPPFAFTPTEGVQRAELVVILSGHGQADGSNCAEWCHHTHRFTLDGTEIVHLQPDPNMRGQPRGCARRASDGVPPGQAGNWAIGRAYWCPGMPVDTLRYDLSEHLRAGTEQALGYTADWAGQPPPGGDIALSVYVVEYEAP